MAVLKKNIWLIFYIIAICATVLLALFSYLKWQSTSLKYQYAHESTVELIHNATQMLFANQQQLLDIMGITLLQDEHYLYSTEEITEHITPLIENSHVLAFGVLTPLGNFIYASSEGNSATLPNIMEQPESKLSFMEALLSREIIFGRLYFSAPLQKWVMPIRKAIRDKEGNPVFVLTTLLKINSTFDHLVDTLQHKQHQVVMMVRNADGYQQYNSKGKIHPELYYQEPFPKETMERMYRAIRDRFALSSTHLKKDETLVSFTYEDDTNTSYLASLKYNKTYNLWIIVHTRLEIILKDFLETFLFYSAVYLLAGVLFFFLFSIIAKAEEKRRNDLLFQATHDQLTKLPNRSYLQQNIGYWIYKKAPSFSIFYIDMDHFKNINDSFGHDFGDHVLTEITQRLTTLAPPDALVTRYGGDEFVLLIHLHAPTELIAFATRLIEVLSMPYAIQELHFDISASLGIATYPEHGKSLDMLLRASDIALYESKKEKNSVHIFAHTMQEGFLHNIHIEQALRKALKHHELFLMYQPQCDLEGKLYGVEALIRWNSPTLGTVPPNHFIPLAEAAGLMPKIGHFVIERACSEMKALHVKYAQPFQVSINISVRQFMEPQFLEHLVRTIEKTEIKHVCITLEVTENLFIEDLNYLLPLLQQIKAMGFHISMDDFGTGYSSLSMLRKLPIDELKIDKSFVDEICVDETSAKMVQNIIAIGKNFGMHILAEGVETHEQKEALIAFGCDRFQGYYFAKPLHKEELETFIQEKSITCKS